MVIQLEAIITVRKSECPPEQWAELMFQCSIASLRELIETARPKNPLEDFLERNAN